MRANYKIPADERCRSCKGWGRFEDHRTNYWNEPHHPQFGYRTCERCKGTGRTA